VSRCLISASDHKGNNVAQTGAALPNIKQVVRVLDGGEITHRITVSNKPLACMLGGSDRKTLYIVTVNSEEINDPLAVAEKASYIEYVEGIIVPGAGLP
jgi:sugar lactone lactonase YvrE